MGGLSLGEGAGGWEGFPTLIKLADFGEALDCTDGEIEDFRMELRYREIPRGGSPAYLPPEVRSPQKHVINNLEI